MALLLPAGIRKAQQDKLPGPNRYKANAFVLIFYTIIVTWISILFVLRFTFLVMRSVEEESEVVECLVLSIVGSGLSNEVFVHQQGQSFVH